MTIESAAPAGEAPSLRDTLASSFDAATVEATASDTPAPQALPTGGASPAPAAPDAAAPPAGQPSNTDGRTRNADGTFAPKPADAPVAPARPKRPDSWAKEYWDDWEKLDPKVAEYLHKRESQYLQGVGTYKSEYDRVKPIAEALQPYQQLVQASGGPAQFIKALADTHTVLSGQDKAAALRKFVSFAKDYGLPVEQLFTRGEDGQLYWNKQYLEEQAPTAQPGLGPQDIQKTVQAELAKARLTEQLTAFATEKGGAGELLHPHLKTVIGDMDVLLRSGMVTDLSSAYDTALRLPKHAALAETDRTQRDAQAGAADAKARQEAAARAQANIVSPRSQAPTALISAQANGKTQDIRGSLSDAWDKHAVGGRL